MYLNKKVRVILMKFKIKTFSDIIKSEKGERYYEEK
jgi:hypothetical protein